MLHKTRGIVLNYTKYRETSIIVHVYTEAFGVQSYIVNSVRSKQAKSKMALFQPLTLLALVVYHKKAGNIHRIAEQRCAHPFETIPFKVKKSGVALFITELLSKVVKEEESNTPLFEFLWQSVIIYDSMPAGYENFHLQFMLKLCGFLGIAPQDANTIYTETHEMVNDEQLAVEEKAVIDQLLQNEYLKPVAISNAMRHEVLDTLLTFYRLHVASFTDLKSYPVLQEVMR